METPLSRAQLLRFPRDRGRPDSYATLYRVGDPALAGPVLVYIGGSIAADVYVERMSTEPVAVRDAVVRALERVPLRRLDVLVCPCPIDTRPDEEDASLGHEWFEGHWDSELEPALGAPPTAMGIVGFSAGAAQGAHLAVYREARALASLGGAGLREALSAADVRAMAAHAAASGWSLDLALFRNAGDAIASEATIAKALGPPLRPVTAAPRSGGHSFADYASNGSATDAFAFVLERLR